MAAHSSILVWKIPWTEEPGRLQFIGLSRVRQYFATEPTHTHTHTHTSTLIRCIPVIIAIQKKLDLC